MLFHVGGIVADDGVPGHDERLAGELEWDSAADPVRGPVAGLADAEFLLCVLDRDLDGPSRGVALDDVRQGGVQVGGDQREVVVGEGPVPQLLRPTRHA